MSTGAEGSSLENGPAAPGTRGAATSPGGQGEGSFLPGPVLIIGTGLIGGSLGLALRATGVDVLVRDISPGTTALAVELGVGRLPQPGDTDPCLVLVAAPPDSAASVAADALREHPRALVADVASVKWIVLEGLRQRVASGELDEEALARYVGTHPMAGREVSGVIAARGDIFLGRPFVVCPHATSRRSDVTLLQQLGLELGSLPVVMDAERHDDAVARVSHAPQVMASLLATSLLGADERSLELAGQGLRDTSRIAASDPRLWVEILSANSRALHPVLSGIRDRLDDVLGALAEMPQDPDPRVGSRRAVAGLIADGNRGVGRIPGKHGSGRDDFARITVLVPDQPGELGRLFTEMGEAGVNLEDLQLEHSLGQPVGIAHVAVQTGHEDLLTTALRERGWSVAEG